MSWVNPIRGSLMRVTALVLVLAIAGCATTKAPEDEAAQAQAEAEEQALQEDFSAAVEQMAEGNLESARQSFEAIHQAYPERTGPLANLGILAMESGDTDTAQTHFETVIELDPEHAAALNHLGVIARQNGEFEKAEDYYRNALEASPDYLPAMMNLAILLDIYLGRPAEALPLYEQYQSMAEDPNPRLKDWIFDVKNRI